METTLGCWFVKHLWFLLGPLEGATRATVSCHRMTIWCICKQQKLLLKSWDMTIFSWSIIFGLIRTPVRKKTLHHYIMFLFVYLCHGFLSLPAPRVSVVWFLALTSPLFVVINDVWLLSVHWSLISSVCLFGQRKISGGRSTGPEVMLRFCSHAYQRWGMAVHSRHGEGIRKRFNLTWWQNTLVIYTHSGDHMSETMKYKCSITILFKQRYTRISIIIKNRLHVLSLKHICVFF